MFRNTLHALKSICLDLYGGEASQLDADTQGFTANVCEVQCEAASISKLLKMKAWRVKQYTGVHSDASKLRASQQKYSDKKQPFQPGSSFHHVDFSSPLSSSASAQGVVQALRDAGESAQVDLCVCFEPWAHFFRDRDSIVQLARSQHAVLREGGLVAGLMMDSSALWVLAQKQLLKNQLANKNTGGKLTTRVGESCVVEFDASDHLSDFGTLCTIRISRKKDQDLVYTQFLVNPQAMACLYEEAGLELLTQTNARTLLEESKWAFQGHLAMFKLLSSKGQVKVGAHTLDLLGLFTTYAYVKKKKDEA
jgi:hypothetical protein